MSMNPGVTSKPCASMVLFAEARWLRTGDVLYRTLARRWTRIMVALFAVGVITGTILSFEMGLLWPNFTGTFGGLTPVRDIDGHVLPAALPGPVTARLRAAYEALKDAEAAKR